MKQEVNVTQSGGISVLGLLGIVFVLCKIFAVEPIATWSWWLVLAPFWIGFAIVGLLLAVLGLVAFIGSR